MTVLGPLADCLEQTVSREKAVKGTNLQLRGEMFS